MVDIRVDGRIDLAGRRRLLDAIGQASGRARGLLTDLSELRFEPTAEDIAELKADGYLGEVITELRAAQAGAPGSVNTDGELARDALALLAGILDERRSTALAGAAS